MKKFCTCAYKIARYVFTFALLLSVILHSQNRFVESINGTYDFDGDGLSEFLAIDRASSDDKSASILSYSEIDENGEHILLWEYLIPVDDKSSLIDAKIADTNGDGFPELIVALKALTLADRIKDVKTVLMFEWSKGSFTQQPVSFWNHLGTSSIAVYDALGDGEDEIAVAIGSPTRKIALLKLDRSSAFPKFKVHEMLTSKALHSGYGRIYITATDYNQDNLIDLVAVSPEINKTTIQVFENQGGEFVEGPTYNTPLEEISPKSYLISAAGITVVDINQNGISDILLPFVSGELVALEVNGEKVATLSLDETVASLFVFPKNGYSPTIINEILLTRAEMGITGRKVRSLKLKELSATKDLQFESTKETPPVTKIQQIKLLSKEPEDAISTTEPEGGKDAAEEPAVINKVQQLRLTPSGTESLPVEETVETGNIGQPEEKLTAEKGKVAEIALIPADVENETGLNEEQPILPERKIQKIRLTTLTQRSEIIIPPGATVSDTIYAGEKFSIPLKREDGGSFHSFKWLTEAPQRSRFDPRTISIQWTPLPSQRGLHLFAYLVEYKVGEKFVEGSKSEAGGTEDQMIPMIESISAEKYIVVLADDEKPSHTKGNE